MAIVVEDAWSSATPSSKNDLVTSVARLYGAPEDPELRQVALDFLDDGVKEMNAYLYEFNKLKVTGISLVADQTDYSLPANFFKESLAYLTDTNNRTEGPLDYLPWVHYQRYYGVTTVIRPDTPLVYSLRNEHREGLVVLGPAPNSGAAAKYTLNIEYYRRIPLVSEENPLNVPQEVETTLVYNAQKAMAIHLYGAGHNDVLMLERLEEKALQRLRAIDKRHPDQKLRFRLAGRDARRYSGRKGIVYIKLD